MLPNISARFIKGWLHALAGGRSLAGHRNAAQFPCRCSRLKVEGPLLETHTVQHLLHLDLVHAHRADGDEFAFEVTPRHRLQCGVV